MNYEKTYEIEMAIANHYDWTKTIIVPNVYWGMFYYELDLCILSVARYASEVEIKVSANDLKKDMQKRHKHDRHRNMIKYFWYAMPEKLEKYVDKYTLPGSGVYLVDQKGIVTIHREPVVNKFARKWTEGEALKLARLGAIRTWSIKQTMWHRALQDERDMR